MNFAQFYQHSIDNPDAFWREEAKKIDWHTPFAQVLDDSRPPFAKWFVGGTTNLCHNAVDRWVDSRGDAPALIAISTETDTERSYSYRELQREVERCAAELLSLGVGKGDRVLIYMPMIAEAAFAMLACARIGAIHSVVFGGFAANSLASRIDDAQPKLMFSSDAGSRNGKAIAYKPLLDEAIRIAAHKPATCAAGRPPSGADGTGSRARCRLRHPARTASRGASARHLARIERGVLRAVHLGHHRQAQGRAARRGRLCGGAGLVDAIHVLRQARRDLFCHLRYRLGGRPLVYRLRPPDRRHGDHPVRRLADPPRCGHLVEHRRKVQGHAHVLGADGDPRAAQASGRTDAQIRSVVA